MAHVQYRPDIDGLRAVAVLVVLLFHAFPDHVQGGYIGVDVFFVISGYLITGILLKEVLEERFSILGFYIRRARRLFPALLLVLLTVFLAGWLCLYPSEFRALGKNSLAGALFVSNVVSMREMGYFDARADQQPLLHLWSLAIEEQYYLLWPLLVALIARRHRRLLFWLTGVFAMASLALSVYLTPIQPTWAFYLPVTRFWELLAGGMLAMASAPTSPQKEAPDLRSPSLWCHVGSALGLGLIMAPVGLFNTNSNFPGWLAALPVAGTMLLIGAGAEAWVNRQLLSRRPMVLVGLISYPLYLWHWPLLAFLHQLAPDALSMTTRGLALALATLLAAATYRGLEWPLRHARRVATPGRQAVWLWALLLGTGLLGSVAWSGGFGARSASSPAVVNVDNAHADWRYPGDHTAPGELPGTVMFIGDSHTEQYWPSIERLLGPGQAPRHTVQFKTSPGCAPIGGIDRKQLKCAEFYREAWALAQRPEVSTVVLAASWYGFSQRPDIFRLGDPHQQPLPPLAPENRWIFDQWAQALIGLRQQGKHLVLVLSSPRGPLVDPQHMVSRGLVSWQAKEAPAIPRQQLASVVDEVDQRVREVARASGAELLSPFDSFCAADGLCTARMPDGRPSFTDESHIRASFALQHIRFLDPFVLGQSSTDAKLVEAASRQARPPLVPVQSRPQVATPLLSEAPQ